jgi:hypothetical protein
MPASLLIEFASYKIRGSVIYTLLGYGSAPHRQITPSTSTPAGVTREAIEKRGRFW